MGWTEIPWATNYEVSRIGLVRNKLTGHVLRPCTLKRGGYLAVSLWENNHGKTWPVHVVIASTFHGPRPSPRHHAAHLDGDKSNNSAANIRWVTKEENEAHKRAHGTANIGTRNGSAKLTPATVIAVRMAHESGERPCDISRRFGIEQSHLSRILNRRLWKELEHGNATGS